MNITELKHSFDIKPCTNQAHDIDFGKLHLRWQVANDYWSTLTHTGYAHDEWFSISRTRSASGISWNRIIIWKLCIMWSWV